MMEIEILTTKKKISKSLIKQFKPASLLDLETIISSPNSGYFVRNLSKDLAPEVAVFQGANDQWCRISIREWKRYDRKLQAKALTGRGQTVKDMGSAQSAENWLMVYAKAMEKCKKNHLYI